jgi:hypothetical protein
MHIGFPGWEFGDGLLDFGNGTHTQEITQHTRPWQAAELLIVSERLRFRSGLGDREVIYIGGIWSKGWRLIIETHDHDRKIQTI